MRKAVFGQPVTAIDIEHLRADTGPTDFVRLCGALIGQALAERVGAFALPQISERINVPGGGIDAEYITPDALCVPETGGLIGPGRTVFQFKYRDVSASIRLAIIQNLVQQLRKEFPRVASRCDRYALLMNVHLSGTQPRRLRDALVESRPPAANRQIVIWGAAEIALSLNLTPHLRDLFFSEGGATPLEGWRWRQEGEDREEWIWDYRICRSDFETMLKNRDSPERLWAVRRLLKDAPRERVLELLTPDEILEALPNTDEPTRQKWEGWARHWSQSH
ncbi:MAG TPA: hypothetical protein VJO34_17020 [Methylomirabilota bacterium]|nr:hypothetical protein [Methylomirabilota bacterium]